MRTIWAVMLFAALGMAACASGDTPAADEPLVIGGIPDQDVSVLEERFGGLADILSEELGIPVRYQPSTDYAALVTAFRNGDVGLGWFGGLTGVQARLATDGAHAVAQRPRDESFTSVFIAGADVPADSVADLAGLSFTFGSESSTSGHLMPRFFLQEAGIDPEADFDGAPSYSGSHDQTWKLVEAGTFQAGALNAAVWEEAVDSGEVDTSKVRVVEETEPYYDYHFVVRPDLDETYGDGTSQQLTDALLSLSPTDEQRSEVLELFQTDAFIATSDDNYAAIEAVARELGLIEDPGA